MSSSSRVLHALPYVNKTGGPVVVAPVVAGMVGGSAPLRRPVLAAAASPIAVATRPKVRQPALADVASVARRHTLAELVFGDTAGLEVSRLRLRRTCAARVLRLALVVVTVAVRTAVPTAKVTRAVL